MKKGVLLVLICLVFLIFIEASAKGSVSTLTVGNTRPRLIQNISNQSWAVNTYFIDAFDLDDYFVDDNGDNLTFYVFGNSNITVVINASTHTVSFYSPANYMGTERVVFIASDGLFNTSSNNVSLIVIDDIIAPWWSSIRISKSTIYQNDIVNFSAIWQDNAALSYFIFSINQGGGWQNYSGNFTGVINTSFYSIQIQYPSGNLVSWRFHAYDNRGNMNSTDVFIFNITARPIPPVLPPTGGGGAGGGLGSITERIGEMRRAVFGEEVGNISNFSIDPEFIKVELKKGETRTVFIKITNIGNQDLNISLLLEGVEKIVVLSDKDIMLAAGESKTVVVDVMSKEMPDLYFGKIIASSGGERKIVPVTVLIKPLEVLLDIEVAVPQAYKVIKPGNEVLGVITIKSLLDVEETRAELYLAIKNFYGFIIDASHETVVLNKEIVLNRTFFIPAETTFGEHFFYARIVYNNSVDVDAESFEVGSRFRYASTIRRGLFFLYFIVMAIIVILVIVRYRRNKKIEKALQLYLMIHELKELMERGDIEKAAQLYIRIRKFYREKNVIVEDKEEINRRIQELIGKISKDGGVSGGAGVEKAGSGGPLDKGVTGENLQKEKSKTAEKTEGAKVDLGNIKKPLEGRDDRGIVKQAVQLTREVDKVLAKHRIRDFHKAKKISRGKKERKYRRAGARSK